MHKITLVTGNPGKLRELQAILPNHFAFEAHSLDLTEIQSLDSKEIVADKLKRAYDIIQGPVVVEDVAVELDDLKGLPGPFYKFFREQMGDIILLRLSNGPGSKVTVRCTAGYYDGTDLIFGEGVLRGTVEEPRGENGFGFDPVIMPEGERRTMAEMTPDEKNAISHRGLAFKDLAAKLEKR